MQVLILDADAGRRSALRNYLEGKGATAIEGLPSASGIEAALGQRPNLIFCAAPETGAANIPFLRQIRENPSLCSTPCIVYSRAAFEQADRERLLSQGAAGALVLSSDLDFFWSETEQSLLRVCGEKGRARREAEKSETVFSGHCRSILGEGVLPPESGQAAMESRFRTMLESSPDWFWEFDQNADFTYVSPRIRDLLGYEPEDLLGKNAFDLMDPAEAERVHRHFDPMAKKYEPFSHLVNVNLHKDGREVVIESSAIPVFDPAGRFRGYRGIDRDITERRMVEEQLRLTQFAIDHASLACFWVRSDSTMAYVNEEACRSLGYPREELLEKSVSEIDPDFREEVWTRYWQEILEKGGLVFETFHRRKDGSRFPVEVTANHVRFGSREYSCTFVRDLSEARQAAERLAESGERFRLLAEAAFEGITFTQQGIVVEVNEPLARMLGYRRQDLLGKSVAHFVAPEDRKTVAARMQRGDLGIYECMALRSDGSLFPVEVRARKAHVGGAEMRVAAIRDITVRKHSEADLRLLRFCIEKAAMGVFRIENNGRIVFANELACQRLGYSQEELCSLHIWDIDPTFNRETWLEHRRDLRERGAGTIETLHQRKDGTTVQVEVTVNYFEVEGKAFSFSFSHDITERKRAEEALRQSEERLRLALMAAHQGLWDLNLENGVAEVSPEYATMLGYDPATFRETNARWIERLHPDDHERVAENFRAYVRGEIPEYLVEFRQRTRAGRWKWILSRGKIVERDRQGQPLRMVGTHTDIDERKRIEEALRESQSLLNESQKVAGLGHYVFDLGTGGWTGSEALKDLLGIDPDHERTVESWLGIVHPEMRDEMSNFFSSDVMEKCQSFDREYRIVRPNDGQIRWVHTLGRLEFDQEGNPYRIIGTVQDITGRKKDEESFRHSEERMRKIFDASPDAIIVSDLKTGLFIDVNDGFTKVCGYSREEVFGKTTIGLNLWGDLDDRKEYVRQLRAQGAVRNMVVPFRMGDGTERIGSLSGELITLDGVECTLGILRDITEQRHAEEVVERALGEAQNARYKLNALLESVADALIVIDVRGAVTMLNMAAEELLGTTSEEAEGRPVSGFVTEPAFQDYLEIILGGEQDVSAVEFSLAESSGRPPRVLQARAAVVRTDRTETAEVIAILRDVTGEREADRMKNEFISIAAHELRTPLTSIIGFAELLEKEEEYGGFPPEQRAEFLETIQAKGASLEGIIDDLLDLSRIESGRSVHLEKRPFPIFDRLKSLVAGHAMESSRHVFDLDFPSEVIEIEADPAKVEQVMDNLLTNAVKYSPSGGTILVSGRRQRGDLVITVADEGIGMTPEQVERVFEKFYRVDSRDTAIGGLGLGMSIARSIVEAHGGRIWVKSEPGRGTVVSFTLGQAALQGK